MGRLPRFDGFDGRLDRYLRTFFASPQVKSWTDRTNKPQPSPSRRSLFVPQEMQDGEIELRWVLQKGKMTDIRQDQ
jgi:hypothetical protein